MSKITDRFTIALENQFSRNFNHEIIHLSGGSKEKRVTAANLLKDKLSKSKFDVSIDKYGTHAHNVCINLTNKNYLNFKKQYKSIKKDVLQSLRKHD